LETVPEKKWLNWFTLIVLLITTIPYVLGYSRQGSQWFFTGSIFGVDDGNSYIAKMLGGSSGEWLFRTPYSAEKQNGFLAFLPYLLLGKLAQPPGEHEQLVALFQIFRWFGGFLFIKASYDFASFFIKEIRWRRWTVVLATVGGGLGWLAILGLQSLWYKGLPLEFYSPESFGFLEILGLPHLACGRAFLLWGLLDYLRLPESEKPEKNALKSGLYLLGLGFMQPVTVAVAWLVIWTHLVFTWITQHWIRKIETGWIWQAYLKKAIIATAVSAPLVIYSAISFWTDPFLKSWQLQNIIQSPPVLDYMLAYGILLLPAYFGAKKLVESRFWEGMFLVGWLVLFPFLAYMPINLQRRLPEGIWMVLITLAVTYWVEIRQVWQRVWVAYSTTSLFSAVIFLSGCLLAVWTPSEPIFRPVAEIEAFKTISKSSISGQVVLSSFKTGNVLPAWAPVHVVTGHGPESANLPFYLKQTDDYYQGNINQLQRDAFYKNLEIQYVFWGPNEKSIGGWNPSLDPNLTSIYNQSGYQIFKVSGAGE
jgi:hypothetical protein